MMRTFFLTAGSVLLTATVVMNAFYQKKQFYPSVVYITKSSPSMAALYLQAFVVVIMTGKFMRKIFFGQLRAAETEHLIERSWYAVTETCLAFTVFRDDFSPRFVALFTILLFLKCFHWLAEDRIDYMERSPLISLLFHIRAVSLIALLSFLDSYFINLAYHNTLIKGPSVQLVFGFEYAILLTVVTHVFVKYILHAVDLQRDNPWENKAVYLLYTELILGGVKVVFYLLFLAIMIKVHTFPLFVIRPMYLTIREFKKALSDVVMSRRAIRNMNTLYPDATPEDLAATDNVCIICREEMRTMCKKLPCNHIFHSSCLRSWFQRQQTCPTCRMDVLRLPNSAQPQMAQAQPGMPGMGQMPPPMGPGDFQFWAQNFMPPPMQPNLFNPPVPPTSSAPATSAAPVPPFGFPPSMPGMMNMSSFLAPQFGFPPVPTQNFGGLSADELRSMQGTERENIEARMRCLRDIQTLLNAATLHLQQYMSIVDGSYEAPPSDTNTASTSESPTTTTATATVITGTPASQDLPNLTTAQSENQATTDTDSAEPELEGAVGYSPPIDETLPDFAETDDSNHTDSGMHEVRRRRIQHFSSTAE